MTSTEKLLTEVLQQQKITNKRLANLERNSRLVEANGDWISPEQAVKDFPFAKGTLAQYAREGKIERKVFAGGRKVAYSRKSIEKKLKGERS